jgi:membrane-associated protease RseP (regulator of RpoE activity)
MLDNIFSFIVNYKYIIIFYLVIVGLVIWKWKKIDVQAKIIFLYRSDFGLKFIEKLVKKYREVVILIGYVGVGAGYVGLVFISYILLKNLYDLLFVADAQSGVALVLPGVNIPGLGVLPFWYWLIAIFVVALVHEFSHGIVARAHKIPVKNTGLVLLGPIMGAFVEPDEKKMSKQKDIVQYSVMAAGPFSNIILALIAVLLLNFAFTPLQDMMVESQGFTFADYYNESYPAAIAGLPTDTAIIGINGENTGTFQEFAQVLNCKEPGDTIIITSFDADGNEKDYDLTLIPNPDDEEKAFLGITTIKNNFEIKEKYQTSFWETIYYGLDWWNGFLKWLFILSLGIGLFNLLPLPIVDGGRMLQITLHKVKGKKKGEKSFRRVSMFFLMVLLINLFLPMIQKAFGALF